MKIRYRESNVAARRGMTMLETLLASALLATVVSAASVLVRTSYMAWEAHESDLSRYEAAYASVRHLVRSIRQADTVLSISLPADTSGALLLVMPSGELRAWAHNPLTDEIQFGIGTADSLLSDGITELSLVGYEADGLTPTVIPADIQAIRCTVKTVLPAGGGGERTISSWAWIRKW